MRLLGAKEFLRTVKPGTLCIQFWMNNETECFNLIKDYESGKSVYNDYGYGDNFFIFGDNSGSLAFIKNTKRIMVGDAIYDCLFYYDLNIVGDASPTETLYLVFEDNEWPDKIAVEDSDQFLTKDELKKIRKWFLKKCGPFNDETYSGLDLLGFKTALNILETDDYKKDSPIVNYK